jgi:ABC-type Zn2+ transport system substrate-binding protein/surface adhesin
MSLNTLKTILRSLQTAVVDGDVHDDDHEEAGHEEEGHEEEGHDDDHEGEVVGDGMDIDTFKIIILFSMIACVGLGFIPKAWGKCRDNEYTLSFLNCFSAGIFLAMSLVHMMPESAEMYADWAAEEGIERPFPLPYVMFFLGYMLILGVDRVAAKAYH